MHREELWQEFDARGERIMDGGVVPESKRKNYRGGVAVMLYRYHDGVVEYLFQRRSKNIISNPGKWDTSFGGHINYEEPIFTTAEREGKEEIGASIHQDTLEFAAKYCVSNRFVWLFFYDYTDQPDSFYFNDQEVEEVKWVPFVEYQNFKQDAPIKETLSKDAIFEIYLERWTQKIQEKYGNPQS